MLYTQEIDNVILPYNELLDESNDVCFTYKRFDGETGATVKNMKLYSLTEVVQDEFALGAIAVWDESGKLIAKQSKQAAIKCRKQDEDDFFAMRNKKG